MNKILTIAIPTKNREKYLIETINSIIRQKLFFNIEVVVCNNKSDDTTHISMQKYSEYENIPYYQNEQALSIDDNMIKVASLVNTKYFLWLGDDDFIVKDGLSKILNYIEKEEYDFVLLSATRVSEDLSVNLGCNLETSLKNIKIDNNTIYKSPKDFFLNHCFHMPFGTLIVKKELYDLVLKENKRFRGTSHAYSGLVFDYLSKKYSMTKSVKILLIREELIMLRQVEKTWKNTATKIMMQEIPEWFLLFDNFYENEVKKILTYYLNLQFNFKSLISRRINGLISLRNYTYFTKYASFKQKIKYILVCFLPVLIIKENIPGKNNGKEIS